MPAEDGDGIAYEMLDFMPPVPNIDVNTLGYDTIKDIPDTNGVKLFHASAESGDALISTLKTEGVTGDSNNFPYRQTALHRNSEDLQVRLQEAVKSLPHPISAVNPKLCFLVTCQGTHTIGMGKRLYETSSTFRKHFDHCSKVLDIEYEVPIKDFLFHDPDTKANWVDDPKSFLPYLLALQWGLFKLWESLGIKPDYVLGLSFGEYGAAAIAGIITIEEAIKLVYTRAKLVTEQLEQQSFCVAMMDEQKFNEVMKECKMTVGMEEMWLEIAAKNSPKQTCLVGYRKYINHFAETCKAHGIKTLLNNYHPYHSSLTHPVLDEFRQTTSTINFQKTSALLLSGSSSSPKFVSSVNGKINDGIDAEYFLDHLKLPADGVGALKTVLDEGVCHFLEIGPHPILIQFVKDIICNNENGNYDDNNNASEKLEGFTFVASLLRKQDERVSLLNALGRMFNAGYDINWKEADKFSDANNL